MLLIDQWQKKAALYRSNTVLSPLGDDFRYMDSVEAEAQYTNFEKMFEYINANVPGVTAQFGTLSEYFHSVMGQFEVPILKGSFFTYSDREQDYWSGYFTSRVFDKALDRKLERVLYAADTLGATTKELQTPRRSLSLFQHHDGVAGTAKTHVVEDYAQIMHTAIHQTQDWILTKVAADQPDAHPCWQSDAPRGLSQNLCGEAQGVIVYNPLVTSQHCGNVEVAGHSTAKADYPCEYPGPATDKANLYQFENGLMTHPIKESWQVWKVQQGGAYLFFPGTLEEHSLAGANVTDSGWVVDAGHWKRSLVEKKISDEFGNTAHVLDFIFETNLKSTNEEWFVRFSSGIQNDGVFHTDLNGFNFDTHHFRADMPIQSQVFPMPTLASIQDGSTRMTIISEHAQGTASLENGSIDVWLDRRLSTDDNRGVGQGVMDNVPTRTKLRVVLEYEGFSTKGEFNITPLCRRMWDELNHPLEAFGKLTFASAAAVTGETMSADKDDDTLEALGMAPGVLEAFKLQMKSAGRHIAPPTETITAAVVNDASPIVPFVFMVYKRVDYLKEVIETLRKSDFDAARIPLIISLDGHVPEMIEYVHSLKNEFKVTQLIHEFACHDHPTTFPGDDPALNEGYKGDTYNNKRSWQITCCKHHFTWMLKTVFTLDMKADAFLFMEEDYTVANNIYENILTSLDLLVNGRDKDDLFGITLDPTDGASKPDKTLRADGWYVRTFVSGPMVLTRAMWDKIQSHATEFCSYDDYNWDWSFVNLMNLKLIPHYALTPTKMLVKHIGVEGMHGKSINSAKLLRMQRSSLPVDFRGIYYFPLDVPSTPFRRPKPFGGWGHPMDQSHCIQVLTGAKGN
jgi:N-acetylglucosaminyltransferase II (MGAT2)/Alpha mannosidase middle domain/Glycosyl hydrolases family 38 C-terminal domain/Glycosyl hydrolases family 38 N-terminal domain